MGANGIKIYVETFFIIILLFRNKNIIITIIALWA
jgi:hypothetical protein